MPELLFFELANTELVARLSADLKLTYQSSPGIFTGLLNIRSLLSPWLVNLLFGNDSGHYALASFCH